LINKINAYTEMLKLNNFIVKDNFLKKKLEKFIQNELNLN